jgi:alkyl sulfatase BDS1-like metallo-beta-lactamase superfamily hydrolase
MATKEECQSALEKLAAQLSSKPNPPDIDRTLSCLIPDLDTGFHAQISHGQLVNIEEGENEDADITLTVNSDDLVALSTGELSFLTAWGSKRIKIDANFMDLLKLRSLF